MVLSTIRFKKYGFVFYIYKCFLHFKIYYFRKNNTFAFISYIIFFKQLQNYLIYMHQLLYPNHIYISVINIWLYKQTRSLNVNNSVIVRHYFSQSYTKDIYIFIWLIWTYMYKMYIINIWTYYGTTFRSVFALFIVFQFFRYII